MTRALRAFKRWMKANGIEYSNAVDLSTGSISGVGVRALCDLEEEDAIAIIPKNACLTIRTSGASHILEESNLGGNLGLAVALMYERSKGTESPWYSYLRLLPHQEPVPLVWTVDDVDNLLAGTELHKVVKDDMRLLCEDWEESIAPLTAFDPIEFRREWFSIEQYFAAKTIVGSRAFEIDDYHGFGMVPLADLFNHKTAAEDVHLTSMSNDIDSDMDDLEESLVDEDRNRHSFCGISDHSPLKEGDTSLFESSNRNESKEISSLGSSKDVLVMILVKAVKEGDEVFNTYGTLSNAALLYRYGFTEQDNPFDIVNVDFGLVIDCLSFSSRHIRAHVDLWRRLGYAGRCSQDCEYFEISANGKPQVELLILLYIIHLSQEAYQNLDYAVPQRSQSPQDVAKVLYLSGHGIEAIKDDPLQHKQKRPKFCVGSNRTDLDICSCIKNVKFGDVEIGNSDEWLLTGPVCQSLLLLVDKRDSLYGTSSLGEDEQLLQNCTCIEQRKLYHAMSLRVSERSILNRLRLYVSKATESKEINCTHCGKQTKQ